MEITVWSDAFSFNHTKHFLGIVMLVPLYSHSYSRQRQYWKTYCFCPLSCVGLLPPHSKYSLDSPLVSDVFPALVCGQASPGSFLAPQYQFREVSGFCSKLWALFLCHFASSCLPSAATRQRLLLLLHTGFSFLTQSQPLWCCCFCLQPHAAVWAWLKENHRQNTSLFFHFCHLRLKPLQAPSVIIQGLLLDPNKLYFSGNSFSPFLPVFCKC